MDEVPTATFAFIRYKYIIAGTNTTPPPKPVNAESTPVIIPIINKNGSLIGFDNLRFLFLLFSKIIRRAIKDITEAKINSIISDFTLTTKKGVINAVIMAPAEIKIAGFLEKLLNLICNNAEFEVAKNPANSDEPMLK
jgi:hypothetical protein